MLENFGKRVSERQRKRKRERLFNYKELVRDR
jgi:hypothetical protein